MSLIDPSTRWWNRWLWTLPWVCWGLAMLLVFLGSWAIIWSTEGEQQELAIAGTVASVVSLLLMIGGGFAGVDDGKHRKPGGYAFFNVVVGYLLAMSLGFMLACLFLDAAPPAASFYVLGVLSLAALVIGVLWRRRTQRKNALTDSVMRKGIKTTGVVTRARVWHVGQGGATTPASRVTVKFTDKAGAARWSSHTVHGAELRVGAQVRVTYVQDLLDKNCGVVVTPQ